MNRNHLVVVPWLVLGLGAFMSVPAIATPTPVPSSPPVARVETPPEGWIWQHLPFAALVEESLRPVGDAVLRMSLSSAMPHIVIDDEQAELTLTDDIALLLRVATMLQMLEARGVTDPFIAASQRAVAFYCHRLGIAHDTQAATRDTFARLPGAVPPEHRKVAAAISESVQKTRAFAGRWFARTLESGPVGARDLNRLGLFERAEGRHAAAAMAFAKAIDMAPTEPMLLNAYRTLLEMGTPEGAQAAADLRAKALAISPRLQSRFDYHFSDINEQLENKAFLANLPELDANATAARIAALARQGQVREAEAAIGAALGRFRNEPAVWRVAAGFYQAQQRRESLRLLMLEANEAGMLRDDGLREFRLVALLDARNEAIAGGPANMNDLNLFESELQWLEGRGEDKALMAAAARLIVILSRHFAGDDKGADTAAEAARAIEGLLGRFGHLEGAWRLAIGGYAALRRLETEGAALRKRLGRVRGDWKSGIDAYLARIEGAYALRAREPGVVARSFKSLEKIAKSKRSGPIAPSERLVFGGLQLFAAALNPKTANKPMPETWRLQLQEVVDSADQATSDGRLAVQAALAGLAALDTMAGNDVAARDNWAKVRAIGEHRFLTNVGAGWSLLLGGYPGEAATFFSRAADEAGTPHGVDYALRAEALAWRRHDSIELALQSEAKAARAAAAAEIPASSVPPQGLRAVFVSDMRLSLTVAWNEPLALNVAIDPVVVLLPLP